MIKLSPCRWFLSACSHRHKARTYREYKISICKDLQGLKKTGISAMMEWWRAKQKQRRAHPPSTGQSGDVSGWFAVTHWRTSLWHFELWWAPSFQYGCNCVLLAVMPSCLCYIYFSLCWCIHRSPLFLDLINQSLISYRLLFNYNCFSSSLYPLRRSVHIAASAWLEVALTSTATVAHCRLVRD